MKTLLVLCFLSLGSLVQCDDHEDEYITKLRHAFDLTNLSDTDVLKETYLPTEINYECHLDCVLPHNVHELCPRYVDVVAAMGDSVTAAMGAGAYTLIDDILQYRGVSWSIGGGNTLAKGSITLPNIIRTFNPDVTGYSIKTGGKNSKNARLNVAVVGDVAGDMKDQAVKLVAKMQEMGVTDEDWKVITIWIGANDLCARKTCDKPPLENALIYAKEVEEALDILKRDVRRAFVNLVAMIDASEIAQLRGIVCDIVHKTVCPCGSNKAKKEHVKETARLYNVSASSYSQTLVSYRGSGCVKLDKLLNTRKYDTDDDFTVVLQPFFSRTLVPLTDKDKPDKSYFAPDCFHFSTKGHRVGATYLWNNMFEAIGEKTDQIDWRNLNPITCPTSSNPYFATRKNQPNTPFANSNDQGSPHSNRLAILMGVGVGVVAIAIVAVVISVGVIRRRRRNARKHAENLQLLSFKNYK